MKEEELTKDLESLTTLLNLTECMLKQEELDRVNSNTETTYGVLKKECIVNDKSR